MNEIKNCACGERATLTASGIAGEKVYTIECSSCHYCLPRFHVKEQAIDLWNRIVDEELESE